MGGTRECLRKQKSCEGLLRLVQEYLWCVSQEQLEGGRVENCPYSKTNWAKGLSMVFLESVLGIGIFGELPEGLGVKMGAAWHCIVEPLAGDSLEHSLSGQCPHNQT